MEAALAKGMDQSDAWNATSVEWVRAAKVCALTFDMYHVILFSSPSGALSLVSAANVRQSCPDAGDVSHQSIHLQSPL